jgi:hypothetical protein
VLLLVITPVSKMGSLPGGCDGAAGLLALGVGGADRFAGALLPGMWSLWPGGGPGGGPGGALPLLLGRCPRRRALPYRNPIRQGHVVGRGGALQHLLLRILPC